MGLFRHRNKFDITYISTEEGWLYLAAVEDLFHRKIVGWALDSRMTKQLTQRAIEQAVNKEKPHKGLIFHSDYTEENTMPKLLLKSYIY